MRAIPFLLIALCAALQALVTVYWMKTDTPQRFAQVFQSFYGTLPPWSALAFSLGWYWLALPIAGMAWLMLAWRRKAHRRNAWQVGMGSLCAFLAMVYAMYPLHLIYAG